MVYRKTCRVCASPHLTPAIDLGEQYLQGSFIKEGYPQPPTRKLPTQLVRCDVTKAENGCGLLQAAHTFPPEVLYLNYWYRSGTNATMRDHLGGIARTIVDLHGSGERRILDIGCNDGTLLAATPATYEKYGVDPSDIAREIKPPARVINTVFPSAEVTSELAPKSFDVITSIAMFYDLEAPVEFALAVGELLVPDGIWILEMSYLPLMLKQNSFDTICHEHIEYYSLAVLEHIVRKAGLRIFNVELNDINGGSIRCYVCHAGTTKYDTNERRDTVRHLRMREFDLALDRGSPYEEFQKRINRIRDEITALLKSLRAQGSSIHIYGASTKGNVLLQWCGIDKDLVVCAADRNPDKVGARILGAEIPIVDEVTSRGLRPDYYLVLPWHFKKEFLARERETILAGTKMIFPLPALRVVDAGNVDAEIRAAARVDMLEF